MEYIILSAFIPIAPTGSPGVPTASIVTSTNITLTWKEISASDRNGVITSYIIQYGVGMSQNETINTRSNATTYVITGLKPYTVYSFAVAGVNSVNTGPFSHTVNRTAEDSKFTTVAESNSSLTSLSITYTINMSPTGLLMLDI